jgi:hypothetical protein
MRPLVIIAVITYLAGASALVSQAQPTAVYTAAQATAGRIELQKNSFGDCRSCHATALTGRTGDAAELPALSSLPPDYQTLIRGTGGWVPGFVGPEFLTRWASRTTRDFSEELAKRFSPPSGQLSEETRLNILAYILQANGALPGTEPLTMATDVSLGVVLGNAVRSIGGERDEKR